MKIPNFIKQYPRSTAVVALAALGLFGGFFAWVHADYSKHPAFWIVVAILGGVLFLAVRKWKSGDKGENQR